MKTDERRFLDAVQAATRAGKGVPCRVTIAPWMPDLPDTTPYIREIARSLEMNEKRAAYLAEKWAGKGWLDYGVSPLAGWLTDAGMLA